MAKFVDGLICKDPGKAPEFVKCKISIKRKDLGNWLRAQSEDWINVDVKVSKNGKWYAEVNEWKPDQKPQQTSNSVNAAPMDDFDSDGIPF